MVGSLTLVATPIGNLGDLSPRAAEALRAADFIAAEDTRVTIKLLNHLAIKKEMISYYEHNKRLKTEVLLGRMLRGEHCVMVSDAGHPCISDPGQEMVALCAESGVPVTVVPGPNAAISALAVSGLNTTRFCFEGFLSVNRKSRREHLEEIKNERRTLLFYEAPHKLTQTLRDMLDTLGDRRIALVRELTKLHEEVIRTTLRDAALRYEGESPRGEFVLVVEGAKEQAPERVSFEEAAAEVSALVRDGIRPTDAARQVAAQTGYPKSELYRAGTRGGDSAEPGEPEA